MSDIKNKKKWYEVFSTSHFGNQVIGETVANDDKALIGRIVNANLGNITKDAKLQNIKIRFRINEVKDGKANTEIKGYDLATNYIKRIIRGGRSKIEDSFLLTTKDNIKVRIKPLILTKYKSKNNILGEIRRVVRSDFEDYIKRETYDKLVSDLVSKTLQRELRGKINKIYPIGLFEIRIMEKI